MTSEFQCTNWAGLTLQQKYDMMHAGPGAAAVMPVAQALGSLAQPFQEAIQDVQATLQMIGVEWDGAAATGFTSAMRQAGQWADHGNQVVTTGSSHVQQYADSYTSAKNAIPNPAKLPPIGQNSVLGGLADDIGLQSAYADRQAQWRQANDEADNALAQHQSIAQQMVTNFPTVAPAPPLTNPAIAHTTLPTGDQTRLPRGGNPGHQPPGSTPSTQPGTPGNPGQHNATQSQNNTNSKPAAIPNMPTSTTPSNYPHSHRSTRPEVPRCSRTTTRIGLDPKGGSGSASEVSEI